MSRIEIDLPDKYHFSTNFMVRIDDVNYGNHLGNDVVATYANETRMRFMKQLGYDSEVSVEDLGLIMTHSIYLFKSEGFYGNEIRANIAAINLGRSGFDFILMFENLNTGKELARALNHMVFFDYKSKKVKSIPERFRSFFT